MPRSGVIVRAFRLLGVLIVFVTGFFMVVKKAPVAPGQHKALIQVEKERYQDIAVAQVYDGDTIRLADGERVRLIGIDTPESSENKKLFKDAARSGEDIQKIMAMGKKAAEYTRSLLDGQRIRLEFDIESRDKYGRILAYVYRSGDGLFINQDIISHGFAYPMSIPPNIRHADEFRRSFREARHARRGLWAAADPE